MVAREWSSSRANLSGSSCLLNGTRPHRVRDVTASATHRDGVGSGPRGSALRRRAGDV